MEANDKLFLDSSRHHLEYLERTGTIRNIDVSQMREVMIKYFNKNYQGVNPYDATSVVALLQDTYKFYNEWLKNNMY